MIGQAVNHDMTAHIMTNLPPLLTVGMRQPRSCICAGVLQIGTRPVVGENVKDDSSNDITFFYLSINQDFNAYEAYSK
ncbi:hypothetical protein TNCV_806671 [Trichonephila clavipes]|nr:hypothetical protein TNCV_806671 [Trichonephila clavipes]